MIEPGVLIRRGALDCGFIHHQDSVDFEMELVSFCVLSELKGVRGLVKPTPPPPPGGGGGWLAQIQRSTMVKKPELGPQSTCNEGPGSEASEQ